MMGLTWAQYGHDWTHSECKRMATFSHLPSGKWRAQVRRAGLYRNATFAKKREAETWAAGIETQAHHIAASGFAPIPQGATLEMLIDKYLETFARSPVRRRPRRCGC